MLAGACFWGLTFSAIEVYWQPRLKDLLGSDSQTWIFGIINSGYFLASLFGVLAIGALLSKRRIFRKARSTTGEFPRKGALPFFRFPRLLSSWAERLALSFSPPL